MHVRVKLATALVILRLDQDMPPAYRAIDLGRKPRLGLQRGGVDIPIEVMRELDFGFQRAFPRCLRVDDNNPALWLLYRISVGAIQKKIDGRASRGIAGEITKRARAGAVAA